MKINLKTNLVVFINLLSVLLGFLFMFLYLFNDICTDHDHWYPLIMKDNIFQQARIISSIFSIFYFFTLPKLFNIHINDITTTVIPFFNALGISVSSFMCLKTFYLFSHEKKFILKNPSFVFLYPSIFIIIAVLPLITSGINVYAFSSLFSAVRHYDHYFCFVFYAIFFYGIISLFFVKRNNIVDLIYYMNAFILGLSTEILPIFSSITSFLTLLYLVSSYKKLKQTKHSVYFMLTVFVLVFFGGFLQFILSTYRENYIGGHSTVSLLRNLSDMISSVVPFLKAFINAVFINNIFILPFIFLLSILTLLIKKNNNINLFIINFMCFLGFLITFLLMFFISDASNIYHFKYYVDYEPLQAMYYKTLFLILISFCGYVVYNISSYQKALILEILLIIYLFIIICTNYNGILEEFNSQTSQAEELRRTIYTADKISLLYNEYDGIALLPVSFYEKYSQNTSIFRPRCYDSNEDIRNMTINLTKKEVYNKESRIFSYNPEEDMPNIDYLDYLYLSYGIRLDGVKFIDDNKAFKEFYNKGGSFSQKELKKLSFTYLKRNFVKEPKIKKLNKEINDNPNSSYLYAARCRYNIKNNLPDEAIKDCTTAINTAIKNKEEFYQKYYFIRGNAYLLNNDKEKAINDYESFLKTEKFMSEVMLKLVYLYIQKENYKNAIKIYENMSNIFPFYTSLGKRKTYYNEIAELYYKIHNYKKVIENVNNAEKYKDININYFLKAMAEAKLNDYNSAIIDIQKAKKVNINNENLQDIIDFEKEIINKISM